MTHAVRSAAVASLAALAAVAALIAADLTPPASAQSEDETTGRIVARRLATGRVEFGWQTPSGARVLPQSRYFPAPADATVDRWLRSSPVEVGGVELGRINARLRSDGRIEFAFTPTDGERILPQSRNFPADARVGRWLRSTEITIAPPAPRYIAVSGASSGHTCGLRENGALECWGKNSYGQTGAPAGIYPNTDPDPTARQIVYVVGTYTAVSAGNSYTCAIREGGAIACWGKNNYGQANAPQGVYDLRYVFTAVSAGDEHTCAIREGGAILCWGNNSYGQSDVPPGRYSAVSAGLWHSCAIRESGTIECWGRNTHRQSDAPTGSYTAVSAGYDHTCGLRASGAIECWGSNANGQSDSPAGRFTAVSAGMQHTCGLRESRAIECWGDVTGIGYGYDLGDEWAGSFTAVSAGRGHTCAIRENGEIACWAHYFVGH